MEWWWTGSPEMLCPEQLGAGIPWPPGWDTCDFGNTEVQLMNPERQGGELASGEGGMGSRLTAFFTAVTATVK